MSWKLTAGKLRDAWLAYPSQRSAYGSVPAGRPIFLTGTHRSGTTWLARMLAASGIWYVHEPFFPGKGRWPRSFDFRESSVRDPAVDALFGDVLAGGFREALQVPHADHPLMPLRMFRPKVPRVLVKDPIACLLTEYLTRHFNLQTVILFRHPASFAASVCRLGWPRGSFLRQFLDDQPLMQAHLEPHRAILERFASEDSLESAAALHGALTLVLWRFTQAGVGQTVMFEDLCADPIAGLERLFHQLDLPYSPRTAVMHEQACFGPRKGAGEYHPHAVVRDSRAMAAGWKKELTSHQADVVRRIWERFDVPLYRSETDWHREVA